MTHFKWMALLCFSLLACSSKPEVDQTSLSLLVKDETALHNDGKPVTLEVDAINADGSPGTGSVTLFAPAGQFTSSSAVSVTVPLVNGVATAAYSCDARKDEGCTSTNLSFLATWHAVTATLSWKVGQTLPILSASCDDTCEAVAGSLAGLKWSLPCGTKVSNFSCKLASTAPVRATLSGESGTTYSATLRFRGVVEQNSYTGGTANGYWYVGGQTAPDNRYNQLKLSISDPPQVYYVNNGKSGLLNAFAIDYVETVPMKSGATVELSFYDTDNEEIDNIDASGKPISLPGIDGQPYNGQFVRMDVLSLTH